MSMSFTSNKIWNSQVIFFQNLKSVSLYFGVYDFSWEFCCYSNWYSSIRKMSMTTINIFFSEGNYDMLWGRFAYVYLSGDSASWVCTFMSLNEFGMISATISSNTFPIPLTLSTSWILALLLLSQCFLSFSLFFKSVPLDQVG